MAGVGNVGTGASAAVAAVQGPLSEANGAPPGVGGASAGTVGSLTRWIIAWTVGILLIVLLNKSKWGHTIIYYTLILMLLFLFLTQYAWLQWALAPFQTLGQNANTPQTPQQAGAAAGNAITTLLPQPATGGATDTTKVHYLPWLPTKRAQNVTL